MSDQDLSVEKILGALDSRDYKHLRHTFKEEEIADLAEVFSELSLEKVIALFRMVPRHRRVDLFSYLEIDRQEDLIEELPDIIIVSLLDEMEPDNRTRLLERLPPEIRHKYLLKLSPKERQVAWQLLSYPEDSVGRLMTPDFLTLNGDMTITRALEFIHWTTTLPHEFLHYLYVTDDSGILIGEVSLPELVTCDPPSLKVSEIMKKNHVFLEPNKESGEAVETFRKYDQNCIPVVSQEKKILGIVTADDLFDVAEEEATEDIQQFGGHSALEDSYFQTPLFTMIQKRALWLSILFVSGFISSLTLKSYEDTIGKWVFLMLFMPLVTSAGGNSGTQAASLVIRGLAIKEMSISDVWRILKKELSVGLCLGSLLATIGFVVVVSTGLPFYAGAIVASSVIGVVLFGVVAGSMLPFLFEKANLDPAVVSSPFISTLLDVTGILIYFNMALWIMSYF